MTSSGQKSEEGRAVLYCEICGERVAEEKCKLCGRRVCRKHYVADKQYCIICRDAICQLCGNYLSVGICKYCGRLGCEQCLVQVSPIEYICIECYRKSGASNVKAVN